ncbi:hypothetical protein ACLOJK_011357, partial [Asimina triloba]
IWTCSNFPDSTYGMTLDSAVDETFRFLGYVLEMREKDGKHSVVCWPISPFYIYSSSDSDNCIFTRVLEEMLKNIFFDVKKKFETALGILRKEKITIDPDDSAAVSQYAKVMKSIREKADLFSESQRVQYTIQTRTQGIPDARTYLLTLQEIRINESLAMLFYLIDQSYLRVYLQLDLGGGGNGMNCAEKKVLIEGVENPMALDVKIRKFQFSHEGHWTYQMSKRGLTDELGAEAMMMEALDKVEKEINKPLLRNDKKGMALLLAEFDKINKKLGIRKEDLPKYEEQLELKIAKAQLEELKKDAIEAMETQKKRPCICKSLKHKVLVLKTELIRLFCCCFGPCMFSEEFKDEEVVDVKGKNHVRLLLCLVKIERCFVPPKTFSEASKYGAAKDTPKTCSETASESSKGEDCLESREKVYSSISLSAVTLAAAPSTVGWVFMAK